MFELALAELHDVRAGDQGQHDVGRVSFLDGSLNADSVRSVDQDTCVLGNNDGFDDGGQVVDIGERFDAEDDIVVMRFFATEGFLG